MPKGLHPNLQKFKWMLISSTILVIVTNLLFAKPSYGKENINLTNSVNLSTHLNTNRSAFNINVITENPQTSYYKDVVTTAIAAGSAIGGGLLGAYFTSRKDREKAKEQETAIRKLVKTELEQYKKFLCFIKDEKNSKDEASSGAGNYDKSIKKDVEDYSYIHSIITTPPSSYTKIKTESTSRVFEAEFLIKIEAAYRDLEIFIKKLTDRNKKYQKLYYNNSEVTDLSTTISDVLQTWRSKYERRLN